MRWLVALLLLVATTFACRNITGKWKNTKGSILRLEQHGEHIHGTFHSAVEVSRNSAGNGAHVRGYFSRDVISFAVKYPTSMAAFTGQCYGGEDKESIHVTWLMHARQDSCDDNWMATRTGSDTFTRLNSNIQRN